MKRPYQSPTLFEYGPLMAFTGETGPSSADDVFLTINGAPLDGRGGSIDGCALEGDGQGGLKCICSDNNTC